MSVPGWGRAPGRGHGKPLQYFCLENPCTEEPGGLRSQGHKESDMTEATQHAFIKWITNENLLYSSRNSTEWSLVTYMEIQKRGNIHIHIADLLCCTAETQHCKATLLSHFSCVRLCATPQAAAHQAPPSLGFSRQEHSSGLPFPSPMHESEK